MTYRILIGVEEEEAGDCGVFSTEPVSPMADSSDFLSAFTTLTAIAHNCGHDLMCRRMGLFRHMPGAVAVFDEMQGVKKINTWLIKQVDMAKSLT